MKKEKSNKIKVKTYTSIYYKDEYDKTIEQVVLKLIEHELESRFSNDELIKQQNRTLL